MLDDAKTGLVIVAHPDDESMWFAGLVLRHPEIQWTVVACTVPRRDPERTWWFYEACGALNAEGRVLPFLETEPVRIGPVDLSAYDVVATHNEAGEYGHKVHRELSAVVRKARPDALTPGYGMADGDMVIELTPMEQVCKMAAILAYRHTIKGTKGTKGERLLARYGKTFNLWRETYHVPA